MSLFGIDQGVRNLKNSFGAFIPNAPFPLVRARETVSRAIQDINKDLWNENPGYAFAVVDAGDPFTPIPDFGEYRFQINPSSIRQDEDFSLQARATQTGVVVEHEGFVFKRLVISGTTGIQPKRGSGGVDEQGNVVLGSGTSGYQDFHIMINFMRSYSEFKTNPDKKTVRLVFKNLKDNEYWFVEPLRVSKVRDSQQPLMYRYELQFLIVGKAERKKGFLEGSFIGDLVNGLDTFILNPIRNARQILENSVNLILQVEREAENIIIQPLREVEQTLEAVQQGVAVVSELPRRFYRELTENLQRVGDNLSDLLGYGNTDYNTFWGRIGSTPTPPPDRIDPAQITVLEAFVQAERGLFNAMATDELFVQKVTDRNPEVASNFDGLNLREPSAVQEERIERGDTLERVAVRYLGSANRWLELVTLNDLEPPYIDPTGTSTNPRVKNPGDPLLIPLFAVTSNGTQVPNSRQLQITRGLSVLEQFMMVDLKINKDNDLIISNGGDFKLVAGFDNAIQAIFIKVNLERGSLLDYPDLGVGLTIGKKASDSVSEIVQNLIQSITLDPRFASVVNNGLTRDGGKLTGNMTVILAKVNQPVPVRVALQ